MQTAMIMGRSYANMPWRAADQVTCTPATHDPDEAAAEAGRLLARWGWLGQEGSIPRASGFALPDPAPPALAVYRIVQESLTNVLKHAGPARGRRL